MKNNNEMRTVKYKDISQTKIETYSHTHIINTYTRSHKAIDLVRGGRSIVGKVSSI